MVEASIVLGEKGEKGEKAEAPPRLVTALLQIGEVKLACLE